MKIMRLSVSDIKKIQVAEICPDGHVVEIAGKNGQGKTTILDSILWALGGKKHIQEMPVRKGAEEGNIEIDLGDYIVHRKIKSNGRSTIQIMNKDGAKYSSPQEILDNLVTVLSFDPLEFMNKSDKERLNMVRQFAPDVDFQALEDLVKASFNVRREEKRNLDSVQKFLQSLSDEEKVPELIDIEPKHKELRELEATNASNQKKREEFSDLKSKRDKLESSLSGCQAEKKQLIEKIKDLDNEITFTRKEILNIDKEIEQFPKIPKDISASELTVEINNIAQANFERDSIISRNKNRLTIVDREKSIQEKVAKAEKDLQEHRAVLDNELKKIQIPVDGIEITPEGIMLDGVPLEQASSAQQLNVGMQIAIKANPKLRALRIKDGSLLDDESMQLLKNSAEENDFQIWIERVGSGGKGAIVIEDGLIKSSSHTCGDKSETKDMFK